MFRVRVELTPAGEAYRQYDLALGKWVSYRWHDIGALVTRWSEALRSESLSLGARVAILMPNGVDHVCMD
jgi:long-chain acyl-CoA synthetase